MGDNQTAVIDRLLIGRFVADKTHSSFRFTVKHMKVASFTAGFDDFDVEVDSTEDGVSVAGTARAESISIKFPPEFREHVLYGAEFFDANNYPEISFRATDVRPGDDGTLALDGELTIKGISAPFTATGTYEPPVEDPYGNLRTAVELTAVVDRRDWNMTWQAPLPKGGDVLAWDVKLTAHVELIKQG